MKYSVLTAQTQISDQLKQGGFRYKVAMLTLTYAEAGEWKPRHVSELLKHVRQWLARRGVQFRFVWVAEMQKRGAIHYHVLLWLPKGLTLPKPDKQGWWPHGSTRIEWARCAGGYMAKYASKGQDGPSFPKGARIHGAGGMEGDALAIWRWWKRPKYVRDAFPHCRDQVRRIRGGWINLDTGQIVESDWQFAGFAGGFVTLVRKPDHSQ